MLTLADLRRRARSRLDDEGASNYLWSDQVLLDCINDTLIDAAIRANLTVQCGLAIPFVQNVDLTWKAQYALPSNTLSVRGVYLLSQPEVNLIETSYRRIRQLAFGRPTQVGSPYSYALDQTQAGTGDDLGNLVRTITFIATPDKEDTAIVDVVRLPAPLEYDEDVPEMDGMWHPDLVYGITGLAYLKKDADTFDPKRSQRDLQIFEDRFGPRLPAVVLRERQTDVPLQMIVG